MLKDKIDSGAFLLLQCSLVESSESNCEFVVVVVRSLAFFRETGPEKTCKNKGTQHTNKQETFDADQRSQTNKKNLLRFIQVYKLL
jgi:hypothetical protein